MLRELPGAAQPAGSTAKARGLLAAAIRQTIQLPPLSSPKDGPSKTRSRPRGNGHRLRYTPLRRRIPSADHALERLSAWAYPRLSSESDGQRPTIHRLHQSRLAQVQADFSYTWSPRATVTGGRGGLLGHESPPESAIAQLWLLRPHQRKATLRTRDGAYPTSTDRE